MDMDPVVLERCTLFAGMDAGEVGAVLDCLAARGADFDRAQSIIREGEEISSIGILVKGRACIVQEDFWGNQNILAQVFPGQLFGESFACVPGATSSVRVVAENPCRVVFLQAQRLLFTCKNACSCHARVIQNLLHDLAKKNLRLNEKLIHVSQRTTKEKLMSYLSAESQRHASASFSIPFNRQQLADYLAVDRSALSKELGKLRDAGVLTFSKNRFVLKDAQ